MLQLLLRAGASRAALDEDGQTALHHAASEGHVPALEVLASSTGDCDEMFVCDNYQMTPFHLACENGHDEAVAHLLGLIEQQLRGPKADKAEQLRRGSALFLAEKNEHRNIVQQLKSQQQQQQAQGSGAGASGSSGTSR